MSAFPATSGKTRAQIAAERRGWITLALIVTLASMPTLLWALPGSSFAFQPTVLAIPLVWGWNFWFYGRMRMLTAAVLLGQRVDLPGPDPEKIASFARGIAMEQNLPLPQALHIRTDLTGAPCLRAYLEGPAPKPGEEKGKTPLDTETCNALLDLLSEDGNIYRIIHAPLGAVQIDEIAESQHARLSHLHLMQEARKKASERRS